MGIKHNKILFGFGGESITSESNVHCQEVTTNLSSGWQNLLNLFSGACVLPTDVKAKKLSELCGLQETQMGQ